MRGVKFNPTPEQIQHLIDNYPNTLNADLAQQLGTSLRTLCKWAANLHLSKSQEFLERRTKKAGEALRRWHIQHPKPPGYRIPRGEEFYFRKGTSIRTRQGEEAHRRAIEKGTAKRRDTIKKERRRILFGLPQQTNLRLNVKPIEKVRLRYYLRKCGYIIDDDKRMAYYTADTKRGERIERKQQPWYTFAPLPDNNN